MAGVAQPRPRAARPVATTALVAALLGCALVTWAIAAERMAGMDDGPGTDLGGIGWYAGIWLTMMAAMMLPSAAPTVALFARSAGEAGAALFAAGYLATWTAFGLAAYALDRLVAALAGDALAWDAAGPYVAGAAVAAAGAYGLTPLRRACLRHCRSPMGFLLGHWRAGRLGAVRMGAAHGAWCVGCCAGLMLVLFCVGVMSVFWMAAIAALVFAEKVLPRGDRLGRPIAVALVALGLWIAVAPGSVPRLTEPGAMAMDGRAPGHGDSMRAAPVGEPPMRGAPAREPMPMR